MTPEAAVAAGTLDMPAKKTTKRKVAPGSKASAPGLIIYRLELTPQAKQQTLDVADRLGMTQIAALSRLVEWFAGQSGDVQSAILRQYRVAADPTLLRQILEPIAKRH